MTTANDGAVKLTSSYLYTSEFIVKNLTQVLTNNSLLCLFYKKILNKMN